MIPYPPQGPIWKASPDRSLFPDVLYLSIIIGIALGYSDAQDPQNKFRSLRRPIQEVVRFIGF